MKQGTITELYMRVRNVLYRTRFANVITVQYYCSIFIAVRIKAMPTFQHFDVVSKSARGSECIDLPGQSPQA